MDEPFPFYQWVRIGDGNYFFFTHALSPHPYPGLQQYYAWRLYTSNDRVVWGQGKVYGLRSSPAKPAFKPVSTPDWFDDGAKHKMVTEVFKTLGRVRA